MKAWRAFETLLTARPKTRRHILDDFHLQEHRYDLLYM
jgi:hypothetical protein